MDDPATIESLERRGARLRRSKTGRILIADVSACTEFGDEDVQALNRFERLKEINLRGCRISDQGLAELGPLLKLNQLDLQDTCVTDACLPQMAAYPELKIVLLSGSRVTEDGIKAARKQLLHVRLVWRT